MKNIEDTSHTFIIKISEAEFTLERKRFFLSLCHMRISVFWGHERLTDR